MADLSVSVHEWLALWDNEPRRGYVQRYTAASTTWTAPAGVTAVTVELWGGGGTGGTAQGNPSYAGGGAGGQYAIKATAVTPGNNYTVAVAQTTDPVLNTQTAGGDSTFATTTVVAKGGAGGANASGSTGSGASGSSGSGVGDTVYAGGSGGNGYYNAGGGSYSGGGGGGAGSTGDGNAGSNGDTNNGAGGAAKTEEGGVGGAGVATGNTRNAGGTYGAGGSGGCATGSTNRTGGAGAAGLARLTWVLPTGTLPDLELEPIVLTDTVTASMDSGPVQTVELLEGTTVRASFDLTTLTHSWQTFDLELTTEQRDAISDWTALRVAITADAQPLEVSWVQVFAPVGTGSVPVMVPGQTETVTLSETGTAVVLDPLLGAGTETVTLSETDPRAAMDERATPDAETVTVGETVTAFLPLLEAPGTETVTLSETDTRAAIDERATPEADTVTVGDVGTGLLDPLRVEAAETVTVGEAPVTPQRIDYVGEDLPCPVNDTVAISDSATGELLLLLQAVADTVTLSEADAAGFTPLLVAATETVTPSEATATWQDPLEARPTDTVTTSDLAAGTLDPLETSVVDTLTWGETGTDARREGDLIVPPISETLTLTDVWVGLDVELREGATVIARWRLEPTATFATTAYVLTSAERAAISDWGALRVALVAHGRQVDVAWIQLQAPFIPAGLTLPDAAETVPISETVTAALDLVVQATEVLALTDRSNGTLRPSIRVFEILFTVPLVAAIPLEAEMVPEQIVVADEIQDVTDVTFLSRVDRFLNLITDVVRVALTPIWTADPTSTVTVTDLGTAVCDLNLTVSDTFTLEDTVPLGAWPEETITWDETGTTADLGDRWAHVAEDLTVQEAQDQALTPVWATIADQGGLTVTDLVTGLLDPLEALGSDTVTLDETGTTVTLGVQGSETTTVGESGTIEFWRALLVTDVADVRRQQTDGGFGEDYVQLTDTARGAIDQHEARPQADALVVGDLGWGVRTGEYRERLVEDPLTLGESGQVEYVRAITITDVVDVRRVDDTRFVSRVEDLTLTDTAQGETPDVSVQDGLVVDEGGEVEFWEWAAPLVVTDAATGVLTPLLGTGTDTVTVSDPVDPQLADITIQREDTLLLSDAAQGERPPIVTVSELLAVVETGTRMQRVESLVGEWRAEELWTLSDTAEVIWTSLVTRLDGVLVTDTVTAALDVLETGATETATLSETVGVALDPLLAASTDTVTFTDAAEHSRCDGVGTDTLTLSEVGTATVTLVVVTDVPTSRTWRVPAEGRTWRVAASTRTWRVPVEPRAWRVGPEDRTWISERES